MFQAPISFNGNLFHILEMTIDIARVKGKELFISVKYGAKEGKRQESLLAH